MLLCFLVSLLAWADAGSSVGPFQVVDLLQGTLTASIPLVLGAMAGLLGERSGVINIAIEGQLLTGAFVAAAVASVTGGVWLGLIGGSLAGGLVGAILAIFAIMFLVDQIIVGVVLNVIALGLTNYLYDRVMVPYATTFNAGNTFGTVKIPVLGNIPIIGPVFFDSNVFLYITYALILVIQIALFRTRWGLRVRAVGEHPTAADTVGIRVLWTRYRNVILGGLVAGIGGAYLTVGSVGFFTSDISSGFGYIALAAMIFGRWTPLGSVGGGAAVRVQLPAADRAVRPAGAGLFVHPADGAVRGDDHRRGRAGGTGAAARRRRQALRQGMTAPTVTRIRTGRRGPVPPGWRS